MIPIKNKIAKFTLSDAKDIAFNNFTEYQQYIDLYDKLQKENETNTRSFVPRSISFRAYEAGFVKRFLESNGLSIADLVKFFFYSENAFPKAALAVMMNKKVSMDFVAINSAKWNYDFRTVVGPNNESVDAESLPPAFHEFAYKEKESRQTLSFNLNVFQAKLIDDFMDQSDYSGLASFMKTKLLAFRILPSGLSNVIQKSLEAKSIKKTVGRAENAGKTISMSIHAYENEFLENLVEKAHTINSKLANKSRLIKYALEEHGVIAPMSKFPLKPLKRDYEELLAWDPGIIISTGDMYDRNNLEEEIQRYQNSGSENFYITLSFKQEDYDQVIDYLKNLNASTSTDREKTEIQSLTKSQKISFTDFIRYTVFYKTFNIYPSDVAKSICFNPPKIKPGRKSYIQ